MSMKTKKKDKQTYWTIEEVIEALSAPTLSVGAKKVILLSFKDNISVEQMDRIRRLMERKNSVN